MAKKYKQLTNLPVRASRTQTGDTDFAEYLKKQLKNPVMKKAYDEEGAQLDNCLLTKQTSRKTRAYQSKLWRIN